MEQLYDRYESLLRPYLLSEQQLRMFAGAAQFALREIDHSPFLTRDCLRDPHAIRNMCLGAPHPHNMLFVREAVEVMKVWDMDVAPMIDVLNAILDDEEEHQQWLFDSTIEPPSDIEEKIDMLREQNPEPGSAGETTLQCAAYFIGGEWSNLEGREQCSLSRMEAGIRVYMRLQITPGQIINYLSSQ